MLILEEMTMHNNILPSKSSLHVFARGHCLLVHNKYYYLLRDAILSAKYLDWDFNG